MTIISKPYKFRQKIKYYLHLYNDLLGKFAGEFQHADLSIFHKFVPPPTGGGHQFLRALMVGAEERNLIVENNYLARNSRACLFNSFNFDSQRLRRLRRNNILYVHRVDGPVGIIRGREEGHDLNIFNLNREFADKTIFQSQFSLQKHIEMGFEFKNPQLVLNAANPNIFHKNGHIPFSNNRKIRIIATSWSSNPNKGASVYTWLDEHLDWSQYEFTFVGNSPVTYKNIHSIPPVPSEELSILLRENDIYITASKNDPCSNSLIEALTCGLPALYLQSGGHPEIVGQGGLGFDSPEEIPNLLRTLSSDYTNYQSKINVPSLQQVVEKYLKILELT